MTADLVERLAQHRALAGAPRQELEWLVNHGSGWRWANLHGEKRRIGEAQARLQRAEDAER